MALEMPYTTVQGVKLDNGYIKIDDQNGVETINIKVSFYASKQARDENKYWLEQELYSFPHNMTEGSPNTVKQGYEYLKTIEKFTSAIDVLEE